MADEFTLTPQVVRGTTSQQRQSLKDALDVSGYDSADILLFVAALEGTTPSVTIRIITGMQNETEEGWVPVSAFSAVTSSGNAQKANFTGFLRYIRWEISALTGTGVVAAFTLTGMLRSN